MDAKRQRRAMWAAILFALLTSASIVGYYQLQPPRAALNLDDLKRIPDVSDVGALPAGTPATKAPPPGGDRTAPSRGSPAAPLPVAQFSTLPAQGVTRTNLVDGLRPEWFAHDRLPNDAPLAEFPLVLVDQRVREFYIPRDMDLDPRMAPLEPGVGERVQFDLSTPVPTPVTPVTPGGGPFPPSPPPPPPNPAEESASGL